MGLFRASDIAKVREKIESLGPEEWEVKIPKMSDTKPEEIVHPADKEEQKKGLKIVIKVKSGRLSVSCFEREKSFFEKSYPLDKDGDLIQTELGWGEYRNADRLKRYFDRTIEPTVKELEEIMKKWREDAKKGKEEKFTSHFR